MFLSRRMNEFEFQSVESTDTEVGGFEWRNQRSSSSTESSWLVQSADFESVGSIGGEFDQTVSSSFETFESPGLIYENRLSESTIGFGFGEMSITSKSSFMSFDATEFYSGMNTGLGSLGEVDGSVPGDSVIQVASAFDEVGVPGFEFSSESSTTTMDLGSGSTLQMTETRDAMASSFGGFSVQSQATELTFESLATGLTESVQMTQFEFNIGNVVMTATQSESHAELNGMSLFESNSLTSVSLEMPVNSMLPASGFNGFQRLNSQSTAMSLSLGLGELQLGFESADATSAAVGSRFGGLFSNFNSQSSDVSLAIG